MRKRDGRGICFAGTGSSRGCMLLGLGVWGKFIRLRNVVLEIVPGNSVERFLYTLINVLLIKTAKLYSYVQLGTLIYIKIKPNIFLLV